MYFTKSRITWFISFCNETMFSSFFTINELCYKYIWRLSSHWRVFHSCGGVTIDCEGLRILTYTLHSPLLSEGSLLCHAYSDTGCICSSPRTRDMFNGSSLSRPRIEFRSPECKANALKLFLHVFSSLLSIYPVADSWTIRKWYNFMHVTMLKRIWKHISVTRLVSNYHATAAVTL